MDRRATTSVTQRAALAELQKGNKRRALKRFRWLLTSELTERRVRLEVKALPVLVEGLHAELAGLLDGHHSHVGHRGMDVIATADLEDKGRRVKHLTWRRTAACTIQHA